MFTFSESYEWFPDTWWCPEGFAIHAHCWVVLDRVCGKNCVLGKLAMFRKAMATYTQGPHPICCYEDREESDRVSFLMSLQRKQRREAGDGLGVIDAMRRCLEWRH